VFCYGTKTVLKCIFAVLTWFLAHRFGVLACVGAKSGNHGSDGFEDQGGLIEVDPMAAFFGEELPG
jgi:hypothetical protein